MCFIYRKEEKNNDFGNDVTFNGSKMKGTRTHDLSKLLINESKGACGEIFFVIDDFNVHIPESFNTKEIVLPRASYAKE